MLGSNDCVSLTPVFAMKPLSSAVISRIRSAAALFPPFFRYGIKWLPTPTAFAPRESALYDLLTEIIHALEICPQILFYVNEADKGMKMDRLYRELLQLPLEDIKMVAESAYKVRRWLDNQDAESEKA